MSHVVLLGDSIFDNARYVPGGPPLIEQLRKRLPAPWRATLLAVDGNVTEGVASQLRDLPADSTHLVVSAGGNDALWQSTKMFAPAGSAEEALDRLAGIAAEFRADYRRMLIAVTGTGRAVLVCTVYDSVPGLEPSAKAGLAVFNEVILREAFIAQVPVLDLRILCTDRADYSAQSPIEPSVVGGAKIARAIADALAGHDFTRRQSVIFP
jgi:hypothetical protein